MTPSDGREALTGASPVHPDTPHPQDGTEALRATKGPDMTDQTNFTDLLVDGGMRAIEETGFATTIEERRAFAAAVTVAVLRNLADETEEAEEADEEWPDSGNLRILADKIEAQS